MEFILPFVFLIVAFMVKQVNDRTAAVRRGKPDLSHRPPGQPTGQYGAPTGPMPLKQQQAQLSAQLHNIFEQLRTGHVPGQQGPAGQYQASVPQYQGHGPQYQPGRPPVQGPGAQFQVPNFQPPQFQAGQFQPGQFHPGQFQPGHGQPVQGQPSQVQPAQQRGGQQYPAPQYQPQAPYAYQPPPPPPQAGRGMTQHRPPQNNLPAPQKDLDTRIRQLVAAHNEVGAIRLLCDERDMGILEAQEYTRNLTGVGRPAYDRDEADTPNRPATADGRVEEDDRYVGSAAFATSMFDTDKDENQWASGWVEKPEPEDRTDMDELWQTVRSAGTPRPS